MGTTDIIHTLLAWGQSLPPAGLYALLFLWLFVESTGFPISDEPLLLLGGTLISQQRLSLVLVIGIALGGKVFASCVAYWIGQQVKLESLARPARLPANRWQRWLVVLRPSQEAVQAVQARFRRQGVWGVFLGRLIPVVRSFISYPAGAARMPFSLFLLATTAGSALWIIGWTLLGMLLGRAAQQALTSWNQFSWIVFALLLVLGGLWLWPHKRRARRPGQRRLGGDETTEPETEPEPEPSQGAPLGGNSVC